MRFSVWYASPERVTNVWRLKNFDDAGELETAGRGLRFRGRNRTIEMPRVVGLELLPMKGAILKEVEVDYESANGVREKAHFIGQGLAQISIISTRDMYDSLTAWLERTQKSIKCPDCGSAVEKGNVYCGKCGASTRRERPVVRVNHAEAAPVGAKAQTAARAPDHRGLQIALEVPPPLEDDVLDGQEQDEDTEPAVSEAPSRKTPKKSAAGPIALVIIAIFIIAGIAYALSGSPGPGGFTGFRVSGSGCWSGAFGNLGSTNSIDGCGSKDIPMHCDGVLSGVAQKNDDGGWSLSLQVLSNGRVIESASTSAAYGVATAAGSC